MRFSRPGSIIPALMPALTGLLLAACQPVGVMTDRPKIPMPWSAAIGRLDSDVAKSTCSATLVARDVIVTAAHCLFRNGGRARIDDFYFLPALGTGQSFLPRRVVGLVAFGDAINPMQPGATDVASDWAVLKIDPAIDYVAPLPILALSPADLAGRLEVGQRLSSAGYGIFDASAGRTLKQQECRLIADGAQLLRLAGAVIVSDCDVIQGDSGGPILLSDAFGTHWLVGLVTGYWRSDTSADVASFGPSAALFAPWVGQPLNTAVYAP
jgi:protease YdgD